MQQTEFCVHVTSEGDEGAFVPAHWSLITGTSLYRKRRLWVSSWGHKRCAVEKLHRSQRSTELPSALAWRLEVLYPSQGVAGKETVTVPRDP